MKTKMTRVAKISTRLIGARRIFQNDDKNYGFFFIRYSVDRDRRKFPKGTGRHRDKDANLAEQCIACIVNTRRVLCYWQVSIVDSDNSHRFVHL